MLNYSILYRQLRAYFSFSELSLCQCYHIFSYLQLYFSKFVFLANQFRKHNKKSHVTLSETFSVSKYQKRLKSIKPNELIYQQAPPLSSSDILAMFFFYICQSPEFLHMKMYTWNHFGTCSTCKFNDLEYFGSITFYLFNDFIVETKSILYRLQNFKSN